MYGLQFARFFNSDAQYNQGWGWDSRGHVLKSQGRTQNWENSRTVHTTTASQCPSHAYLPEQPAAVSVNEFEWNVKIDVLLAEVDTAITASWQRKESNRFYLLMCDKFCIHNFRQFAWENSHHMRLYNLGLSFAAAACKELRDEWNWTELYKNMNLHIFHISV